MKCPYCGGRRFTLVVRHVQYIEYSDSGIALYGSLGDFLGREEDTHFCLNCNEQVNDHELEEQCEP